MALTRGFNPPDLDGHLGGAGNHIVRERDAYGRPSQSVDLRMLARFRTFCIGPVQPPWALMPHT